MVILINGYFYIRFCYTIEYIGKISFGKGRSGDKWQREIKFANNTGSKQR